MRALVLALLIALIRSTIAVADGSDRPEGAADRALTVYASFPLSGPLAATGRDLANATRMAFADAAWRAGVSPLQLVILDDGGTAGPPADSDRERANAATAAADPATVAYLGPYFSTVATVSIPILCAAGIVAISPSASRDGLTVAVPGITDPGEPGAYYQGCPRNFARVAFRESIVGADGAALAARLGARRAYVVGTSEQFLRLQAEGFTAAAPGLGVAIVGAETVTADTTQGIGDRLLAAGADVVYLASSADVGPVAGSVVRAVRAAAPGLPIIASPANVGLLGPEAEAVYATGWAVEVADYAGAAAAWHARFEAQFGPSTERYALYAYEAARAVIAAIRRTGAAPTRDAVRDAMLSTAHYPGLLEHWSFDAAGDTTATLASVFQVRGGQWRDVGTVGLP